MLLSLNDGAVVAKRTDAVCTFKTIRSFHQFYYQPNDLLLSGILATSLIIEICTCRENALELTTLNQTTKKNNI